MVMVRDEVEGNRKLYETGEAAIYYTKEGFVDNEAVILKRVLTDKSHSLLDLGCGAGRTTKAITDLGYTKIIGVDYSSRMVDMARDRYPQLHFQQGDACDLAFPDESFDMVLFLFQGIDCIESDKNRAAAYMEIHRVLKPGGTFLHSAHNILWLNHKVRLTWVPFIKNILSGRILTSNYRTLPHGYGDETLIFRRRGYVVKELKTAGFINIEAIPSRKGYLPIFHPYWHFLARKPQ